MKTVVVLALDGVMDSSLAITFDTIRTGQTLLSRAGKGDRVRLVVAGHTKYVRTSAGLRLEVDVTFSELRKEFRRPHWVVVPALGMTSDEALSARLVRSDAVAAMNLLQQLPPSVRVAASCSSVFMLAATGLLRGREATTTWWLAHLFRAKYPEVRLDETKMLVRDGPFLTAGSAYSQLDLMLAVVTDTLGPGVAHLCARYLLIDQRPSQARYMIQSHMQHVDPTVVAAERWIDGHLSHPIRIAELSAELGVSPRTLARRITTATGASPVKFIQRRRLLQATHLIETTSLSIDAIAERVGYQDGTALRKLIKRDLGITPATLRN